MTLDQILGTYSLPLEHDGLHFRLVPFTTAQITEWQEVNSTPRQEDESTTEWNGRIRDAQLAFLEKHLRACVVEGDAEEVTAGWVAESLPNVVVQDLVDFMVHARRPAWAGESGK